MMSDKKYQITFYLTEDEDKFSYQTTDDITIFRDFLLNNYIRVENKCIIEYNALMCNKNTDKNIEALVRRFNINFPAMNDDQLKKIGLERIKIV